ncbi:hypothetical protein EI77_01096 [Prosthecobacter fusiformis]|uniref:Uncharacterized protein n=1 Tax=Prosthecobacter fusiformis TaxID=48464 RepID=A0A4R7STF7_9BACT|nr:hypothetical protein [Prosthecobacter fusiformis]TDU81786.1 hypothetical protein EI77_01096 [Prosthecobacter fusiformis]
MSHEIKSALGAFALALIFGLMGVRGLVTGKAEIRFYEFDRHKNFAGYWIVIIAWWTAAAVCLLYSLGTLMGVML